MLGMIKGKRRRRQRMRWLDSITDSMDMSLSKLPGDTGGQRSWVCCSPSTHRVGHNWATEQQHIYYLTQNIAFSNTKDPHRDLPSRNYFYVRDEKLGFKNHDVQSQRITWYFCHMKFLIETLCKLIFCKCRDSCGLFGSDYWKSAIKKGWCFQRFFFLAIYLG